MNNNLVIEKNIGQFKDEKARIFLGAAYGEKAREVLELDKIEASNKDVHISILVPRNTWGINPSFFRGLFEKSIIKYKDKFVEHYSFLYDNHKQLCERLSEDINFCINTIVLEQYE